MPQRDTPCSGDLTCIRGEPPRLQHATLIRHRGRVVVAADVGYVAVVQDVCHEGASHDLIAMCLRSAGPLDFLSLRVSQAAVGQTQVALLRGDHDDDGLVRTAPQDALSIIG